MASDTERKRGKGGEEAAAKRTKRARLDEEGTSSERELALHPSDEDLFSLALVTGKEPSDISPDSYPSSDGLGSFQLTKTEGEASREGSREGRKRSRQYRGATEEVLQAERGRGRKERERKSEERKRHRGGKERKMEKSSSTHSSPHRSDGGRGGRERERVRRPEDRYLLRPPSDERYYARDFQRGDIRRGEGRGDDYPVHSRSSLDFGRLSGRGARERDEGYYRHSTSPRPSDYGSLEWRGSKKGSSEREGRGERERERREEKRVRRDHSADTLRYERSRIDQKHRRRKRSREEHEERREIEGEGTLTSRPSEKRISSSPQNEIKGWIKELQGEDSGSQERRDDDSSSGEDKVSSDEDVKRKHRKVEREEREDRSSISGDDPSEEGEIVEENISSEESGVEREGDHLAIHKELSRSETEPILRSKFDDSSESSSEEEEEHRKLKNKHSSIAVLSQRSQSAYSGYAEVVSGSDQSNEEVEEDKKRVLTTREIVDDEAEGDVGNEPETPVEEAEKEEDDDEMKNLPPYLPALMGCRNVEEYEWLNRIEEGTYGVVYRARDKRSGEVVALKKLKMEKEKEGFPITSLREINMLLKAKHPNVVFVKELVVGSNMDRIYIVMDYVEHDMKALMETMKQPFLEGEVKILLLQLLRAVHHLHDNWILHRDLKTSNLLLSHKGILKVGDFGLAREYGSPLRPYTPVVVTLWYRAPELLLGCKTYSTPVDMWSVGCIFAEFLQHKPLFMGKSEIGQLNQIFKELGTPSEEIWTGYNELPVVKKVTFTKQPYNNLRKRFPYLTQSGFDLLNKFLTYDPKRRITGEKALEDPYFKESPLPVDPSMFPTWPAKSEKMRRKSREKSPTPPMGGNYLLSQAEEDGFKITSAVHGKAAVGAGFSLKF